MRLRKLYRSGFLLLLLLVGLLLLSSPAKGTGYDTRRRIVDLTYAQLGKPYSMDLDKRLGPYYFDCSGLAYYAYTNAGVYIPNTTFDWVAYQIDRSELLPGDLTFKGWVTSPLYPVPNGYHMGVYVGDGLVIEAANSTLGVIIRPIDYGGGWTWYGRVPAYYWPDGDNSSPWIVYYKQLSVPTVMYTNTSYQIAIKAINKGTMTWRKDGPGRVYLTYKWVDATTNQEITSPQPPQIPLGSDVGFNQEAVFDLTVASPSNVGNYILRFDMVQDGVGSFSSRWNKPLDVSLSVVDPKRYNVSFSVNSMPTTSNYCNNPNIIKVTLTNTGTETWIARDPNNQFNFSYHWVRIGDAKTIVFNGERTQLPYDVPPGGSVTLDASVKTAPAPGDYVLVLDMVKENMTWFSWAGSPTKNVFFNVKGDYSLSWGTVPSFPQDMLTNQDYWANVTVGNLSPMTWGWTGSYPVHLAYHWVNATNGQIEVFNGERTSLPGDIGPGGEVTLRTRVRTPSIPGTYILKFDMVHEDVTWFSWQGKPTQDVPIRISSIYPNGTLIKTANNPAVYLLDNGKRRWITSPASFLSHGFLWDRIRTLSDFEMSLYPPDSLQPEVRTRPGTLLKSEANPAVYVTDFSGGTYIKRWIASPNIFESLGYRWESIMVVSDVELASYADRPNVIDSLSHPNGLLIKTVASLRVYLLEEGKKRWIVSPAAFLSHGFQWDKIVTVSDQEVQNYLAGPDLQARPGTLLKGSGPAVYVIDLSSGVYTKRWIPSQAMFEAMGYRWSDIFTVTDLELATYGNGAVLN